MTTRVLFAASEAYPLIKTGGLADVANALPNALMRVDADVRVILPAYPEVLARVSDTAIVATMEIPTGHKLEILECCHEAFSGPIWLVDSKELFGRPGNPYVDGHGQPFADNHLRYYALSVATTRLAVGMPSLDWQADVVHCNDWQTGLVPALLSDYPARPCSVFTIHNISYDCLFDYSDFEKLQLPKGWWSIDGGEFYSRFSMLKCGIVFADRLTTVSSRYAREILTDEYGYGHSGILKAHAHKLSGILNGVDMTNWNPTTDTRIARNYASGEEVVESKRVNREALLNVLEAPGSFRRAQGPLIGFIGRLVYQKGIDLLLDAIPLVLSMQEARFVIVGAGDAIMEDRVTALCLQYPQSVVSYIGYSEDIAHLLEAGSDLFVMPSRFEPCGLNQIYSMLYGTLPVVRATGGLADTVCDLTDASLANGTATGFVFEEPSSDALATALIRALQTLDDEQVRTQLMKIGMTRDFSWDLSAQRYRQLYESCQFGTQ
jgi:starch synthase